MNKILKAILIFNFSLLIINSGDAQFTKQDTLRGSNGPGRDWWDVIKYDISVSPSYSSKTIRGKSVISFKILGAGSLMQIDLQEPMQLTNAICSGTPAQFSREKNVYFLTLPKSFAINSVQELELTFEGKPREALRPPWDGGWIFKNDAKGRAWMSVACQGLGASVWYPCKDYQGDEPDMGARLTIHIPGSLVAVANGHLKKKVSS
ncbi:MAG TPA: M1 family peptidase, partial [Chitinophagaceae bacterium]|nr:M1 family peptidase [Chitinophagaceae bacterium]